ncbi:MAG: hypothetical protein V7K24_23350 [Nostoc sp.]
MGHFRLLASVWRRILLLVSFFNRLAHNSHHKITDGTVFFLRPSHQSLVDIFGEVYRSLYAIALAHQLYKDLSPIHHTLTTFLQGSIMFNNVWQCFYGRLKTIEIFLWRSGQVAIVI